MIATMPRSCWELTVTDADGETAPAWAERPSILQYTFPEETCPECGRVFLRRCARKDWGWTYCGGYRKRTMLCSGECYKAFAARALRESAQKLARTRNYRYWHMMQVEGMSLSQIARAADRSVSMVNAGINTLEAMHPDELEYLRTHPEVAEG